MSNQLQVYRSYLPSREQIQPFAIAAIIIITVFSFANVVFGQNNSSSVVDQTITSVTEKSEPAKEAKPETTEEAPKEEANTSATVVEAVNTQVEQQKAQQEAAAKEKKQQKEQKAQQEQLAVAVGTNEEMPNTGPVENAVVTVAIVAIGYSFRNFIRSKAELIRAVEKA